MDLEAQRPIISEYSEPVEFFSAMLRYRKMTEPKFSVYRTTSSLRRVSAALVSLILKKKRRITLDRADEFSALLGLSPSEKFYFKNWLVAEEKDKHQSLVVTKPAEYRSRKEVGTGLLSDWVNVYVKDMFQLDAVQKDPKSLYRLLGHIASPSRIDKSLRFLLREGYLRKTMNGRVVVDTNLAISDPKVPSQKIRRFHKSALKIAQRSIDLFSPSERLANTLTVPLNHRSYQELMTLVDDFSEKLKEFAEKNEEPGEQLYQLIVNISPVGGKQK